MYKNTDTLFVLSNDLFCRKHLSHIEFRKQATGFRIYTCIVLFKELKNTRKVMWTKQNTETLLRDVCCVCTFVQVGSSGTKFTKPVSNLRQRRVYTYIPLKWFVRKNSTRSLNFTHELWPSFLKIFFVDNKPFKNKLHR